MNIVHLISKKRDGHELTDFEIGALIDGYVRGEVHDYQMSAWAMAVFLRGMTVAEIASLTERMLHSGFTFKWPEGEVPKVDKHSTGGIGDKVSLPLAPLLACCDLQVPMISGRGLGATGGTLDKLEAIPGYRTDLSTEEFQAVCRRVGCVIIELGGGRKKLGDVLDLSTGLEMLVRLGDKVETSQPLVRVFAKPGDVERIQAELLSAIVLNDEPVTAPTLIVERIS